MTWRTWLKMLILHTCWSQSRSHVRYRSTWKRTTLRFLLRAVEQSARLFRFSSVCFWTPALPEPSRFSEDKKNHVIVEDLATCGAKQALLTRLPVSPAQTNKAAHELSPSYPVTLLRILSFFAGQWAFVEEKIIVWASVAAVWLLWCDIQRLWNCQMNNFADQHWPMLLQLLLVHVLLVRQLRMERAAPLGAPVEPSQPVCTFLILLIPHLHWLSNFKKETMHDVEWQEK